MHEFKTGQLITVPLPTQNWSALNCLGLVFRVDIVQSQACGSVLQVFHGRGLICEQPIIATGYADLACETTPSPADLKRGEIEILIAVSRSTFRTYREQPNNQFACAVVLRQIEVLAFDQTRKGTFLRSQADVASNADVSAALQAEIQTEIQAHVSQGLPYSLIRLGDGEGRLLACDNLFNVHEILRDCIGYQYGPQVFELMKQAFPVLPFNQAIDVLRQSVVAAIHTANRIAVPSASWFGGTRDSALIAQAACHYARRYLAQSRGIDLASCPDTHFLRNAHRNQFFAPMVAQAQRLFLITSFDVAAAFECHFGRRLDGVFTIPGHQTFSAQSSQPLSAQSEPQFPFFYRQLIPRFRDIRSGDLVFVGAGYLGKLYCAVLKHQGAVAIDIGSLFDAWAGQGRPEAITDPALRLSNPSNPG